MTQFPYDDFIKQYILEILKNKGLATPSQKIHPEVKDIDVWFIANEAVSTTSENLYLLDKLTREHPISAIKSLIA